MVLVIFQNACVSEQANFKLKIANPDADVEPAPTIPTYVPQMLDQIDDDNSAAGFGSASHTGTIYTGSVLTLNATTSYANLDRSWTPKWSNLRAYWKFDESSWVANATGTIMDSVGTYHGTPRDNANTSSTVKIGTGAGAFDGTGDYVSLGNTIDLSSATFTSGITISAWVKHKTGTAAAQQAIFASADNTGGSGWQMHIAFRTDSRFLFSQRYSGAQNDTFGSVHSDRLWHHVVVSWSGSTTTLYVDGILEASATSYQPTNNPATKDVRIGHFKGFASSEYQGVIDDVAIWNAGLNASDVALIYARQSAKYAGVTKSRIMDSYNTSSTWTHLDWIPTLPFGKELPDGGGSAFSESPYEYTSLSTSTLMEGIAGLWHFNEAAWADVVDEVRDTSGLGNHGRAKSGALSSSFGRFKRCGIFDGTNDYLQIDDDASLEFSGAFTIAFWFATTQTGNRVLLEKDSNNGYSIQRESTGHIKVNVGGAGTKIQSANTYNDGYWHHVVFVYRGPNNGAVYVDGRNDTNTNNPGTPAYSTGNLFIGSRGGSVAYAGRMDEVAMWSHALSHDDIVQLYRRGANRIKYQVRSCTSIGCTDQEALTGGGWKGPGGNYLTYFSEVYNNSSISSSCSIPQQCYASELSLDGDVQTDLPSMFFNTFGAHGISVSNNRYFQYRAIMESDDENFVCSASSTCVPQIKSVEVGPAHSN